MRKRAYILTVVTFLVIATNQAQANNKGMKGSTSGPPSISHSSEQSGAAVKSGAGSNGTVIYPISGFSRGQCNISVSGAPTQQDGGYKRSRHFSLWTQNAGSGWRLRAAVRNVQGNQLNYQSKTSIQYQVVCAK